MLKAIHYERKHYKTETYAFALKVIQVYKQIDAEHKEYDLNFISDSIKTVTKPIILIDNHKELVPVASVRKFRTFQ